MNQAWVDRAVIEPALDFKVDRAQMLYDQQRSALTERAFNECSMFAFRRTSARVQEYLDNDLVMRLTANRIEDRYNAAMDKVRELQRLIHASVDGRVMMDGETTTWLFDVSYSAHVYAAKLMEGKNEE